MIPEIRTCLLDHPKDEGIEVVVTKETDSSNLALGIFGKMISEMES